MTNREIATIKISLMILPIMFFYSVAFANISDGSLDESDSIYKYNALENKISFRNSVNILDSLVGLPSMGNNQEDETTKNLQDIIEKQNFSVEQVDKAINFLNDRSEIKTFLLGNNLGMLRFQLVQINDQTFRLKALAVKNGDNIEIANQIDLSEQEQAKVENFILKQKSEFSLFGWLVSSF